MASPSPLWTKTKRNKCSIDSLFNGPNTTNYLIGFFRNHIIFIVSRSKYCFYTSTRMFVCLFVPKDLATHYLVKLQPLKAFLPFTSDLKGKIWCRRVNFRGEISWEGKCNIPTKNFKL